MAKTREGSASGLLSRPAGEYGFDEPVWPVMLGTVGVIAGAVSVLGFGPVGAPALGLGTGICAIVFLLSASSYVYTTRRGKYEVWTRILRGLALRGNERLLDLGCGRGAVLLLAARLLRDGSATGVDVWNTKEQSGNSPSITERNAQLEGVAARVELRTADMRSLPFPPDSFDIVVSSLAIHNISEPTGRRSAIDEAVRVLRPGGRIAIADFHRAARSYENRLRELGMTGVVRRTLGWRFWYGGPWAASELVEGSKPPA